ncbi:hypothetical protein [Aquimarina hainanensis]
MKTFDIKTFEKNKNHLNEYIFLEKDSTKIFQKKRHSEFKEVIISSNSYFQTINRYYLSGKFKSSVKYFPNQFLKGLLKEYDEQGNLIKETNYDAPYKFTWEDILKLIKERKLDMDAYGFLITRGTSDNGTAWSITYNKSEEDMLLGVIIIDGITGKIIKEFDEPYPSEE